MNGTVLEIDLRLYVAMACRVGQNEYLKCGITNRKSIYMLRFLKCFCVFVFSFILFWRSEYCVLMLKWVFDVNDNSTKRILISQFLATRHYYYVALHVTPSYRASTVTAVIYKQNGCYFKFIHFSNWYFDNPKCVGPTGSRPGWFDAVVAAMQFYG